MNLTLFSASEIRIATPDAESNEFFTPKWLLGWLGQIALDPCHNAGCNVTALRTLDLRDGQDGLNAVWADYAAHTSIIFVNPPYSDCSAWVEKCAAESDHCTQVIAALVPAYAGDAYWHRAVWNKACYVGFIKGRIRFDIAKDIQAASSASFCSALILWGNPLLCKEKMQQIAKAAKHSRHRPFWVEADRILLDADNQPTW